MADTDTTSMPVLDDNYASFEKALHSWLIIDLPSLQKSLDTQGLEIQDHQKTSLISRKELATKTKSFKKLNSDEKLQEINPLLKSYQNEIDSLTKKNKSIESVIFNIYRAIADAPDPKPLLEIAISSIASNKEVELLKEEKQKLQEKLLKYADYEQLKLQSSRLEKQFEQKILNKEKEMQAVIDEKESNWKFKEEKYEKTIKESIKEVEELKISQQVMELKLNNRSDIFDEHDLNNKATNIIELEMIQRDAESSRMRVLQLEKRNEQLTRELSKVQNKDKTNDKINELTTENLKLSARLEHEQAILNSLKRESSAKVEALTIEIRQLKNEVETLKEKLKQTSDYDELKKELDVLKEIEFGGLNDDDQEHRLDSIIIQTNRKLNADLVEFRSKNEALSKKIADFEKEHQDLKQQVSKLADLNKVLENDLSSMNGTNGVENGNWDAMSMISTVSKATPGVAGRTSPATSIAGSLVDSNTPSHNMFPDAANSSSILPIITQQRDRFKARNNELEEDVKRQFRKIVDLKRELANLKNDNKELYERIRYLSSYSSNNQQEKRRNTSTTSEFKYEEDYERELHPIEQFRLKESQRISSKISPVERLYISMIRFILSSPLSRYLFAAYCAGLHLIIVILFLYVTDLHMDVTADITEGSTGGFTDGGNTGDTRVAGDFVPDS